MIICGWVLRYLQERLYFKPLDAHRVVFYMYTILGLAKASLTCAMSGFVEAEAKPRHASPTPARSRSEEITPLLHSHENQDEQTRQHTIWSWMPKISKESMSVVSTLIALFALDSFASGLTSLYVCRTYLMKSTAV